MKEVPKFPSLSSPAQAMPESLYAILMRRLEKFKGPVIQFQIGDTYLGPPEQARLGNLGFSCGPDPELYRYSPLPGKAQLIDRVVDKVRRQNGMSWVKTENIQITAGATHGLSCAMRAVMNHGDQVLLLAPYWPLMRGISRSVGVRPIEVPFSHVILRDEAVDIRGLLEASITPETAGIYLSTPNNPDGKVYTESELSVVADLARRHNLWVIADEVYESFVFDGRSHHSIATLPGMAERTVTVYSFSKTYGLPDLRLGYTVGPTEAIVAVRKMSNHTVYSVPKALQRAALASLEHGADYVAHANKVTQEARDAACAQIAAPVIKPQGSTYLFLDLSQWCMPGEDSCLGVLERMAEAGILLAPGAGFGHLYQKWARLCYTSVPREQLEEGIARFNRVLEECKR